MVNPIQKNNQRKKQEKIHDIQRKRMISLKKLKPMKYNSTKLSAKTSANPQQQHKLLSQFQSGTTEYNHIFTNQTGYWRV